MQRCKSVTVDDDFFVAFLKMASASAAAAAAAASPAPAFAKAAST